MQATPSLSPHVAALLFPVPKPSYSASSFDEELLWIPRSLDYSRCEKGSCVPGLFLQCPDARYLVLYLHSNGEDMGLCYWFVNGLRRVLEVHVLVVEYPGYGICPGTPSEESLRENAELAFRFATEVLGVLATNVIVMGRSLGGALAVGLAERFECCGLVLISPFLSLIDAISQYIPQDLAKLFIGRDVFCNRSSMKRVQFPTLICHGQKDMLISCEHGRQLVELCMSSERVFISPEKMGHNDDLISNPDFLIRPMLSFFAIPDYIFEELRAPPEAFDKRLCPLYHGIVELTKYSLPLSKPAGDEGNDSEIKGFLEKSTWKRQLLREVHQAKYGGPQLAEFQCYKHAGDPSERISSNSLKPGSSDDTLPGIESLDLDGGVSRSLKESEAEALPVLLSREQVTAKAEEAQKAKHT